jgi:HSP20 family protein
MFSFDENRVRLFDELFRAMSSINPAFRAERAGVFPQVNVYDDGESFLVRAEVSGLDKDKIDVSTRKEQLTIRGQRTVKTAEDGASYHRRERDGGQFRRTLTLPQPIDADKVSASYRDGVLEIVLPRAPEAKQRTIPVK